MHCEDLLTMLTEFPQTKVEFEDKQNKQANKKIKCKYNLVVFKTRETKSHSTCLGVYKLTTYLISVQLMGPWLAEFRMQFVRSDVDICVLVRWTTP